MGCLFSKIQTAEITTEKTKYNLFVKNVENIKKIQLATTRRHRNIMPNIYIN
jgi:hypothetical protein